MGRMKADEENCHKPEGEFCAQCRERKRLRRELADILIGATAVTEADLKDVL
jgi:hypothetical protein